MTRLILILLLSFFISKSEAQEVSRNSIFDCASVFGDSITFLNDFTVSKPKRKTADEPNGQEWEVYLMKGTVYRFALCNYSTDKHIIMKLYDDTVTEKKPYRLVYAESKKTYFDYVCKKSSVYKVSIRFEDKKITGKELAAIGILGFIRKIKI